ncbi:MAG TPA: hypothetical protein VGL40_04870 [Bacillota bacterium]|jgi:hypothetical protein
MRFVIVLISIFGLATASWPGWIGPALLVLAGSLFVVASRVSTAALGAAGLTATWAAVGLVAEATLVLIARRRYGPDPRQLFDALAGGVGTLLVSGLLVGPLLGLGLWRSLGGTTAAARLTKGAWMLAFILAGRAVKFIACSIGAAILVAAVMR